MSKLQILASLVIPLLFCVVIVIVSYLGLLMTDQNINFKRVLAALE